MYLYIAKQDLFHKWTVFQNFIKWGMKGGISIDVDSGPLGYVLWCCGSRSQDFFTFIQIGSGHTAGHGRVVYLFISNVFFKSLMWRDN